MKTALLIVFVLGLGGSLFSGTLTYRELTGGTALSCPAPGASGTILRYPACVYGFGMFVIITIVSGIGLWVARNGTP